MSDIGLAVCFDAYEGALKLETADIKGDTKQVVDILKTGYHHKFPYEDLMGDETFMNPKNLTRTVDAFLKKMKKTHPKIDSFFLYFHGHGVSVLGEQCIITNEKEIIPVNKILHKVYSETSAGHFYMVVDCCSEFPEDQVDEVTKSRVAKVTNDPMLSSDNTFDHRVVVINAAHRGHKAPAAKGETFSTAMVSVLRETQGRGIPISDLQKKVK